MVVGFTFFYTDVLFAQQNYGENLKRAGAQIPGVTKGAPTQKYLTQGAAPHHPARALCSWGSWRSCRSSSSWSGRPVGAGRGTAADHLGRLADRGRRGARRLPLDRGRAQAARLRLGRAGALGVGDARRTSSCSARPGAGKGTQAQAPGRGVGPAACLERGSVPREHEAARPSWASWPSSSSGKGKLVPDDVTIEHGRASGSDAAGLRPRGAVLDGFPRTPAQAEALDATGRGTGRAGAAPWCRHPRAGGGPGRAPDRPLDVPGAAGTSITSQTTRRKTAGVCDIDGSELYQREDDKPETVTQRIQVYLEQTAPLDRVLPAARACWSRSMASQPEEARDELPLTAALKVRREAAGMTWRRGCR